MCCAKKSSQRYRTDAHSPWQALGAVIDKPGQSVWLGEVDYTE